MLDALNDEKILMKDTIHFPIGHKIRLPGHFNEPVILEAVRQIVGGFELRVRLSDGSLDEAILSSEEAETITEQAQKTPQAAELADPEKIRLLIESVRIRLAYAHDRQFAVSMSGIRTLPHQIEAIYLKMLPQPRLRFLLADFSAPGGFKNLDRNLIFSEYWTHPGDPIAEWRHGSIICAEILVPNRVDPGYIVGVYVSCLEAKAVLEEMNVGLAITLNPKLFFK